jgi:hypothetical protein
MEIVIGEGKQRQPQILIGQDGNVVIERPRRQLSESQIRAMAEGRRQAASRRRVQKALVKCATKYQRAIQPGPKSPTKIAASEKNPYVQFLKERKEVYKGQMSSREMIKKIGAEWRELKARGDVKTYKEQKCPEYFGSRAAPPRVEVQIEEENYGDYSEEEKSGSSRSSTPNAGDYPDEDAKSQSGSSSSASSSASSSGSSSGSASGSGSGSEDEKSGGSLRTTVQGSVSSRSTPRVGPPPSDEDVFAAFALGSRYLGYAPPRRPQRRRSPPRRRGSASARRRR